MSTILVRRKERRKPPPAPKGELLLESPPEIPETQSGGLQNVLMYMPMAVMPMMMGLMLLGGGTRSPIMMIGSGGMALVDGRHDARSARPRLRRAQVQAERRAPRLLPLPQPGAPQGAPRGAEQQREALEWNSPAPDSLWSLVMSARLWERRPRDYDFGNVRIGAGAQKLAVQLIPPETKPVEDLEPMTAGALRRFVRAHSTVPTFRWRCRCASFARILLDGRPRGGPRAWSRAHDRAAHRRSTPPTTCGSACARRPSAMPHWDWVKWLPHAMHPERERRGRARSG